MRISTSGFLILIDEVLLKIHITFFSSPIALEIKSAQLKELKAYFLSCVFSGIYNYIFDFLCINKSIILPFNFFYSSVQELFFYLIIAVSYFL